MARLDNSPIRLAKANVDRWFAKTPAGPAFLPGNGKALPIDENVALGIRAGAEQFVARSYDDLQKRMLIHMVIIVLIVVAIQYIRSGLDPVLDTILLYISYALYTAHGLFALNDAWKWERSVMDLRDAIAHALREKVPLPPTLAGGQAVVEPDYRLLGGITFSIVALFMLFKGVKLPDFVSPWLPAIGVGVVVGIVTWIAGFVWLQRIGALPPEDGPRRG